MRTKRDENTSSFLKKSFSVTYDQIQGILFFSKIESIEEFPLKEGKITSLNY
jgi:hypothetical protein